MRQAIVTKYLGPTNTRGARVKATCEAGSVTIPWDDSLYIPDNHTAAATALIAKLDWGPAEAWISGALPDGTIAHIDTTQL